MVSYSELLVELGVAALPAICGRIGPGLVVSLGHVLLEKISNRACLAEGFVLLDFFNIPIELAYRGAS